jgi:DNA-binding NarL/FixJ family response regulator
MIRVLLADDQTMLRAGLRTILNTHDDIVVVGEAADGRQAVEEARRLRPDVALMDVRMPAMDGIQATRQLAALGLDPPVRVLVLTTFDLDEYVYAALRAGASGFLLKDAPPQELVHAIGVVAAGDAMLAPSVTRRLIRTFAAQPQRLPSEPAGAANDQPRLRQLTDRELEVLKLLAGGLTNLEIAESLTVSETTVKTHVGRVLAKLGLHNRVQAAVLAYETGLGQLGQDE